MGFVGDETTTQLYRDYFINHYSRIPINQPVYIMECHNHCSDELTPPKIFMNVDPEKGPGREGLSSSRIC